MGYGLKLLAIFTCLALGFLSGTLLFMKGFLLKRIVIDEKNKCNESIPWSSTRYPIRMTEKATHLNRGCWIDTKFSKAVIIIVDALRYDFAVYNDSLAEEDALPFQNKLHVLHEMMRDSPQNARLYRFLADPPTTTMQRLKGLTTGSLPTFVDAGSNFASYEIKEDNIISKLADSGKKIIFMGDDTWEGLFPKTFHKSFPFPSFNVKDLDTVDNGVIKHLVPELKQTDWDVIIGHFLGVDHCGHKYGPYHIAMADKLTQMDKVLRSVIDVLDDKTVLFVLGDHGMTRTGDHGGDSDDELDAALFVYSKSPLADIYTSKITTNTISQVDFVPTFSFLLGLPIPFGSLGSAVTELFTEQGYQFYTPNTIHAQDKQRWPSVMSQLKILHLNAYQVDKYLQKYQLKSNEIPKTTLKSLKQKLENATEKFHKIAEFAYHGRLPANSSVDLSISELEIVVKMYSDYLSGVKELCHGLWAKFDVVLMILGIFLQTLSLVVMAMSIFNQHFIRKTSSSILKWTIIIASFSGLFCFVVTPSELSVVLFDSLLYMSLGFNFIFAFYYFKENARVINFMKNVLSLKELTAENLLATLFCVCYFSSCFSNSYIVHEDSTVLFTVSSLVTFLLLINFVKSRAGSSVIRITHRNAAGVTKKNKKEAQKFDLKAFITSFNFRLFIAVVLFIICGRFSSIFRACREEQTPCEPSSFLQPLASLQGMSSSVSHRFFLSSVCVALLPIALYCWLRYQGNLNGSAPVVLCVKYSLPFSALFICIHWALQILPQASNSQFTNFQLWQQIVLPQFAYWLCLLTLLLLLWQPLCLYTLLRDRQSSLKDSLNSLMVNDSMDARALQTVFREVKRTWENRSAQNGTDPEDDGPPMVYGLGTVYSCPVLVALACFAMVVMLVLSDGMVGSIVLLLAQMVLFAEMQASFGICKKGLPWHTVVVWGLMSSQYFFNTGHQATIPAIRFEAAFVGLPGDMNNLVLPGLLIFLNTFASSILFALGLPVLLLWPRISNRILGKNPKRVKDDGTSPDKGEFGFSDKPEAFREHLFQLLVMFLCFKCFKVLLCACSAGLHRRHLMVWKIFAPRFVFESTSFLISLPFMIFAYLLVLRTDSALDKWTERLQTHIATKSKMS